MNVYCLHSFHLQAFQLQDKMEFLLKFAQEGGVRYMEFNNV